MRVVLPLSLLSMAPAYAFAAGKEGGGEFSIVGGFIQMFGSLAVVVGVIFLFYYVSNRWLKNSPAAGGARYIRLIETRHIAPKKSLMLVEVGGEYLLISNSGEGIQFVKQVEVLEEIEVIGLSDDANRPQLKLQKIVSGFVARLPQELGRCFPVPKKSGSRP